jgi:hypothetical protein
VITEEQMAALRTLLARDFDAHRRVIAQISQSGEWAGYNELITAAFSEAVDRRFGHQYTLTGIVEFVADVRTRFEDPGQGIDPGIAERLIRKALGEGTVTGIDKKALIHTEGILLSALIMDEHLDAAGLDGFLASAREMADGWLSQRP